MDTERGVPLVEARTVNDILYVSDNAGRIAFDEPGLLGRRVFFHLRSHGYEVPKDGFGMEGVRVETAAGGLHEVKLKRVNVAERMYRITGQGLYGHSVRLGHEVPLRAPLLNAQVMGQDSAQVAVFQGRIHWFWGDTDRASYPLGQFQTSGAVSRLPEKGGLEPSVGIDLDYFARDGFSRPMAPMTRGDLVWIDGLVALDDPDEGEVLLAHFSRRKDLATQLEHGLLRYNSERNVLEKVRSEDLENEWRHPRGQATIHEGYVYFAHPFATTRVRADLSSLSNPDAYEALARVPEDSAGPVWQKDLPPMDQEAEAKWLKTNEGKGSTAWLQLQDEETGKAVRAHAGSIRWNDHRKRWILIANEVGGRSYLGEVWYAESRAIEGPWHQAVRIVTHKQYSFYNPVHHRFFDRDGGRLIHFEGTFTAMFSGNPVPVPRYDYNQILYRLDLEDPRLAGVRVD